MEKFIKLLDPWNSVPFGPGLTIAEQAIRARQAFPEMVARSNLAYWRPGDAIQHSGTRFLLGLAVSFSLSDLYLADLLNEALGKCAAAMPRVDVFDLSRPQSRHVSHAGSRLRSGSQCRHQLHANHYRQRLGDIVADPRRRSRAKRVSLAEMFAALAA